MKDVSVFCLEMQRIHILLLIYLHTHVDLCVCVCVAEGKITFYTICVESTKWDKCHRSKYLKIQHFHSIIINNEFGNQIINALFQPNTMSEAENKPQQWKTFHWTLCQDLQIIAHLFNLSITWFLLVEKLPPPRWMLVFCCCRRKVNHIQCN